MVLTTRKTGHPEHSYQMFTATASSTFKGASGLVLYRREHPVAIIEQGGGTESALVRFVLEAVDVPSRGLHRILTAEELGELARTAAHHQHFLPALPFPAALIRTGAFTAL